MYVLPATNELKLIGLPGLRDWSPDVMQAISSKPASSSLLAAAVDLQFNFSTLAR